MKRFMLLGIALCLTVLAGAQRVYFIYLQTEDASPFFIKMNNQVYSSSYGGYLILSNLKDSTYTFSVGPVASGAKEPQFTIAVAGTDRGYLIKSFKDYTGLFDLQKLSILKPNETISKSTSQLNLIRRTDAFSVMLALSAGDSSLLYNQVAAKAEVKASEALVANKEDGKDSILSEKAQALTVVPEVIKKDTIAAVASNPSEDLAKVAQEPKKTDSSAQTVPENSQAKEVVKVEEKAEPAKEETTYVKSTVVKRSESSTTEGFGLVFFDNRGTETDTIRLLIPNPKVSFAASHNKEEADKKAADTIAKTMPLTNAPEKTDVTAVEESKAAQDVLPRKEEVAKHTDSVASEPVVLKSEPKDSPVTVDTVAQVKIKVAEKTVASTSCKAQASDNDFFKVRKNMASRDADEDMVAEARKVFKTRCFTTEQIRNLGALFLTPSGKYQFFDASYGHVSDPQNFSSLQNEIKDDYNLKRFKALIGE